MSSAGRASSPSSQGTSPSLLSRVRTNDAAAWDRLVRLYAPTVLAWSRRQGDLQDEDAADVLQEVFQAVAANIGRFRKDRPRDSFRGWLRTITRNKVHDLFRRKGRQPSARGGSEFLRRLARLPSPGPAPDASPDEPGDPPDPDESPLFRRALAEIQSRFKETTWQAFWRTVVGGQAPATVAAELGLSPGAVRVAKSRVLHHLRDCLGDLPEAGP